MVRRSRLIDACLLVLLALATAACAGARSPSIKAAASAAHPSASVTVFNSERYGYSVSLPAGWYVKQSGEGTWTPQDLNYDGAGTDSFEEDYPGRGTASVMDFPGVTYGLYISSATVAAGTTLGEWSDTLAATVNRWSLCPGAPDRETTTAGGEPASLIVYDRADCRHDTHALFVGVLHHGSGYALTWLARHGEDARRADFDRVLAGFAFTR
jgi:hypothetical protein